MQRVQHSYARSVWIERSSTNGVDSFSMSVENLVTAFDIFSGGKTNDSF